MAGDTLVCITPNAIRAAIGGVSEDDVPNATIVDLMVEDQLILFLNRVYPDYQTLIDANTGTSPTPTPDEKNAFRALKLVCTYAGAVIVLQGAQYLLAQTIESGGVSTQRFSKDDIDTTLARMEAMRDQYLGLLNPAVADISINYVSPLITVSPDYDPVYGNGCGVIGYHDALRRL